MEILAEKILAEHLPQVVNGSLNRSLKYTKRVSLTVLLLMLINFQSQAQWSFNTSIGKSQTQNTSALSAQHFTSELSKVDNSDISWSMGLSYNATDNLRLGVTYVDMGDAALKLTSDTLTASQYHRSVAEVSPILVDGFALEIGYSIWKGNFFESKNVQLDVFIGGLFWKSDIKSQYGDVLIFASKEGLDPYYGLAIVYQLTSQWQLGLGFQRFTLPVHAVDNVFFSVTYQF